MFEPSHHESPIYGLRKPYQKVQEAIHDSLASQKAVPEQWQKAVPEPTKVNPKADATLTSKGSRDDRPKSEEAQISKILMAQALMMAAEEDRETMFSSTMATVALYECLTNQDDLPVGGETWIALLKNGRAQAMKWGPFDNDAEFEYMVASIDLRLLSWTTDGGKTLPLEVSQIVKKLKKVCEQVGQPTQRACVHLVTDFWIGVSARLCDIHLLEPITPTISPLSLSPGALALVAERTLLASCELRAVRLLAPPSFTHGSLVSIPQFVIEFPKLLWTLQSSLHREAIGGAAAFLAVQIIITAEQKINSTDDASSTDMEQVDTVVRTARKDLKTKLDDEARRGGTWMLAAQSALGGSTVDAWSCDDVLPERVAHTLAQFEEEYRNDKTLRIVDDEVWATWLRDVCTAEKWCRTMNVPTRRGRPGMWMYRDRQLASMRKFGDMYKVCQRRSNIHAHLRNTLNVLAAVCGEPLTPTLWPHVVIAHRGGLL
eukprot:m.103569 g.103569  ORF g.103569 m.103569 type:complete len:487 (-) comp10484_c0_seq1:169-1629(-)